MQMMGRTSVISLGQESAHRDGGLFEESGIGLMCMESHITHSRCHPCDCPTRKVKHENKAKKLGSTRALPESHNVTVPNLFGWTTPRFGILTGNTPDTNLFPPPESESMKISCPNPWAIQKD